MKLSLTPIPKQGRPSHSCPRASGLDGEKFLHPVPFSYPFLLRHEQRNYIPQAFIYIYTTIIQVPRQHLLPLDSGFRSR